MLECTIPSVVDPTVAPTGRHLMSMFVQWGPYHLKGATWPEIREKVGDNIIDNLEQYIPNIKKIIIGREVLSPWDLEQIFGLTEGNIFQGAMGLDQLFASRPLSEIGSYKTPIDGYYLCGAGTHPGGGVMGANGHNAAKVVLGTAAAAPTPPGRGGGGLDGKAMSTKVGKRVGYAAARQPALRPIAKLAARTGKPSGR